MTASETSDLIVRSVILKQSLLLVLNITLKEYMKAKYLHVKIVTTKQVLKHSLIITSKKYMKVKFFHVHIVTTKQFWDIILT